MTINTDRIIQNRAEFLCLTIKNSNLLIDTSIRQLTQGDRQLIRSAIDVAQHPETTKKHMQQISSERVSFISKIFTGDALNADQKDPWVGGITVQALATEIRNLDFNQIKSAVCKAGQKNAEKMKQINERIQKLIKDSPLVANIQKEIDILDDKIETYNDLIDVLKTGKSEKINPAIAGNLGQGVILELKNLGESFSNHSEFKKILEKHLLMLEQAVGVKQKAISEYKNKDIDFSRKIQKLELKKDKYSQKLREEIQGIYQKISLKEQSISQEKASLDKLGMKLKEFNSIDAFFNSLLTEPTVKKVKKKVKQELLFQLSPQFKEALQAIKKSAKSVDEKKKNAFSLFQQELRKKQVEIQKKKQKWIDKQNKINEKVFDVLVSIDLLKKHQGAFTLLIPFKAFPQFVTASPSAPPEDEGSSTTVVTALPLPPQLQVDSSMNPGAPVEDEFEDPPPAYPFLLFPNQPKHLPSSATPQPLTNSLGASYTTLPNQFSTDSTKSLSGPPSYPSLNNAPTPTAYPSLAPLRMQSVPNDDTLAELLRKYGKNN